MKMPIGAKCMTQRHAATDGAAWSSRKEQLRRLGRSWRRAMICVRAPCRCRRALQRDCRVYVQARSVRRRFLHGVRLDEPVCRLTELHQAAARIEHIQFVHAPRRFDDLTHIGTCQRL